MAVTALTAPDSPAADLVSGDDAVFQVPSIFDAEVLGALRGLVRDAKFDGAAAAELVPDLMVLPVDRWLTAPADLDVLVIGDPSRDELDAAAQRAEGRLAREVNVTIARLTGGEMEPMDSTPTSPCVRLFLSSAKKRWMSWEKHDVKDAIWVSREVNAAVGKILESGILSPR